MGMFGNSRQPDVASLLKHKDVAPKGSIRPCSGDPWKTKYPDEFLAYVHVTEIIGATRHLPPSFCILR